MTDQTTQTTDTPAEDTVQLQLADLMLAAQVIQLASQRGAIRAEEMTQVGGLYTRLVAFLQASGTLTPATPADASTDEPASTDAPAAE